MSSMVRIRSPGPKLTEWYLTPFERALGRALPADYRSFVLEHNGGEPKPRWCCLSHGREVQVSRFLSIAGARLDSFGQDGVEDTMGLLRKEVELPAWVIPIARGPVTKKSKPDLFLLTIDGHESVRIEFRDGRSGTTETLAGSFQSFLDRLEFPRSAKPWMETIFRGDLEGLRRWLEGGGNPQGKDDETKATPLSEAVAERQVEMVKLLLDGGAKVGNGLMQAIELGYGDIARVMLNYRIADSELEKAYAVARHPAGSADEELIRLLSVRVRQHKRRRS